MGCVCFDIIFYLHPHERVLFFLIIIFNFFFPPISKSSSVVAKGALLQIEAEVLYSFRSVLWFDCQKHSFESFQIP